MDVEANYQQQDRGLVHVKAQEQDQEVRQAAEHRHEMPIKEEPRTPELEEQPEGDGMEVDS